MRPFMRHSRFSLAATLAVLALVVGCAAKSAPSGSGATAGASGQAGATPGTAGNGSAGNGSAGNGVAGTGSAGAGGVAGTGSAGAGGVAGSAAGTGGVAGGATGTGGIVLLPDPSLTPLRLVFPTYGTTDQAEVLVHGTGHQLKSVTVNKLPAQTTDGFQTWKLPQALAAGDNAILVEGVDQQDKPVTSASVVVTRSATLFRGAGPPTTTTEPSGISASADGSSIHVANGNWGALSVDVKTGNTTFMPHNLSGNADPTFRDAVFVEKHGRVYMPSGGTGAFYTDLATGNLYTLPALPATADDGQFMRIAYRESDDRLITIGSTTDGVCTLLAIDPLSGARAVLAAGLKNIQAFAFDPTRGVVYTSVYYQARVSSLTLSDGTKAMLPAAGAGAPAPNGITDLAVCPGAPVIYALEAGKTPSQIDVFDLTTGAGQILVGPANLGRGVAAVDLNAITCQNGVIFASRNQWVENAGNPDHNMILAIDPATGDRLVVSYVAKP
jgi:hypothetical protein